jgi:tetraacyldisaccharide 4'-kinase
VTRIRNVHPTATVAFVQTRPAGYLQCDGRRWPLEHLERQSVWGFCGIGNPAGFEQTLIRQAVNLKATTRFADHHAYTRADLEQLAAEAKQAGSTALVCTHKDLVKVGCQQVAGIPVYALMIETDFLTGLEELQSLLIKVTAAVESE